MAKAGKTRSQKWTVLFLSEDGERNIQRTLHPALLRIVVSAGAFLFVALLTVLGAVGVVGGDALRSVYFERENTLLAEELTGIREQIEALESDLGFFALRDQEIRLVAGLDEIDEQVLQAGIGGPGHPTLEENPLYPIDQGTAEEAFAVSYDLSALQRRAQLLKASLTEASDSLTAHRALLGATPAILPTSGRLTSGFSTSRLHPIHSRELPHEGLDIAARHGAPIFAAANGRVTRVGRRAGYGLVVELNHGYGYSTLYGHASQLLVTRGQEVERGDVIAQVGTTGISTAPHLHYEVRINNRPVNPVTYLLPSAIP